MGSGMVRSRGAVWMVWAVAWGLTEAGCSGAGGQPGTKAGAGAAQPLGQATPLVRVSEQAVVIDGSTIPWEALHGPLAEIAGVMVLEELTLDRALARETERRGLTVGEDAVRAEERALLEELSTGPEADRLQLLEQVRRSRGLGPLRYEALLRRNAALRALVRESAAPTAEELELARRLAFGETLRVRLFVSPSEAEAARFRSIVLEAPAEGRPWVFAERAAAGSEHPSGARGGLVERLHPDDPAYPALIGRTAKALGPGEVSPVLATAAGFTVMMVEGSNPAREPAAGEVERVERRVRQRKERLAMERLARELIERSRVSPIDPDLARAWRARG